MDKIILGILMLRRMTAYEIKNTIKSNFKSICSDSLGSIQIALKKLFEKKLVTCDEVVENGVNKKRYAITGLGQKELIEWLKEPIDISKTKNMDFGKLLFMGFVPRQNQSELIDKVILSLEQEYNELIKIKNSINIQKEKSEIQTYLSTDEQYKDRIKSLNNTNSISKSINEISKFTLATLDYGIDMTSFNIDWFKKFKERIVNGKN